MVDPQQVSGVHVLPARDTTERAKASQPPAEKAKPEGESLTVGQDPPDRGWGDGPIGYDDDWYLSQRPPHHE